MTRQIDATLLSDLRRMRRELHAQPEVSGEEQETAARIRRWLRALEPDDLIEGLGGSGLAAVFAGAADGPTVLFRAELDALPIQEVNDFPHRSVYAGVGHQCGHDGHMATLLGLGRLLARERPARGRVVLLFQPAEETGEGAARVLASPDFQALAPDYIFAYHNLPGFPLRRIVVREDAFSASVQSLIIRLQGRTSHAAEPEMGRNPAWAMADILRLCQELTHNDPESDAFAVVTPVYAHLGEQAYGTAAGYGEVHLTIRTWRQASMEALSRRLTARVEVLAAGGDLTLHTEWLQVFRTTRNDPGCVALVRQAAAGHDLEVEEKDFPFRWGEDFGAFTQQFPGAMFGIGAGEETPALHNPDYDFPDEILEAGVAMFRRIARDILG